MRLCSATVKVRLFESSARKLFSVIGYSALNASSSAGVSTRFPLRNGTMFGDVLPSFERTKLRIDSTTPRTLVSSMPSAWLRMGSANAATLGGAATLLWTPVVPREAGAPAAAADDGGAGAPAMRAERRLSTAFLNF